MIDTLTNVRPPLRRPQNGDGVANEVSKGSRTYIPPAMRYPAYRRYWLGFLASVGGFQMFQASQFWLVHHDLKGTPLSLGLVGLFNAVPGIVFNLVGGVFADKFDKRKLLIATQVTQAVLILVIATLTWLGLVQMWHILTAAFLAGSVNAFDGPTRQALYPRLVERQAMTSAVALNSSVWQSTRIAGPAISGVVIATAGTAASLYLAALGFVVMAIVMYRLHVPPMERSASKSMVSDVIEGLGYVKRNSVFSFLISMTFFNSFFGMAYVVMMPVFAEDILHKGAGAYGLLLSASGVGSLITTLYLGSHGAFRQRGLLLIGGATLFGLSIVAFALTSEYLGIYPLALALMFLLGIFNSAYMISIQSSLQLMVPDQMRGRIMGFYGMTWSISPLGGMQAGAIASFTGVPFAVAIGGLAVSAFALGPALVNRNVRQLGSLVQRLEGQAAPGPQLTPLR